MKFPYRFLKWSELTPFRRGYVEGTAAAYAVALFVLFVWWVFN